MFSKFFSSLIITIIFTSVLDAQIGDLLWAKQFGGPSADFTMGVSIAVDASGNVYSTGFFEDTVDFDPGLPLYELKSKGFSDIYISKLDKNGNFLWAKSIGGVADDIGVNIGLDPFGDVYVTGSFRDTADFDTGTGVLNLISKGKDDGFILKLNAAGVFLWAKQYGSISNDIGYSIAFDKSGNSYSCGQFLGLVDFGKSPNIENLTSNGDYDAFVLKLDKNGNTIWAKNIGGALKDQAISIAVDDNSNVFATGLFKGTADFDPSQIVNTLTSIGAEDIFILKLDGSGNYKWAKQLGGAQFDQRVNLAIDKQSNVFTTSLFYAKADFDPSAATFYLTPSGLSDVFISKLDSNGIFKWAKKTEGSSSTCETVSLALDKDGAVYFTGSYSGEVDFDPGPNKATFKSSIENMFIVKWDAAGNYVWGKNYGDVDRESGTGLTVDNLKNVYCTGRFRGTLECNPGGNPYLLDSEGKDFNAFIIKIKYIPTVSTYEIINEDVHNYPNPVYDFIYLDAKKLDLNRIEHVCIYDVLGKMVFQSKFKNGQNQIEIKSINAGHYTIQLQTQEGLIIKKFIKY
jgi:Secretion system C-terminal sorting domain/Beta-propeller repeat